MIPRDELERLVISEFTHRTGNEGVLITKMNEFVQQNPNHEFAQFARDFVNLRVLEVDLQSRIALAIAKTNGQTNII